MKKTVLISIMIIAIAILVGCTKTSAGNSDISSDPLPPLAKTQTAGAGGYVYMNSGATFEIDAPAADPLDKMGDPLSYFEASSCAFGEQDKVWTYPGFRVDTYQIDGTDYVMDVVLTDDTVITTEGVRIGDNADTVTNAYGDPTETGVGYMLYESGDMKLVFMLDSGTVSTIEYLSKKLG